MDLRNSLDNVQRRKLLPLPGPKIRPFVRCLKTPRQGHFLLFVEVNLKQGKALGSEEDRSLRSGFCYEQRSEAEKGIKVKF
jgi:hypothetical protein